MYISIFISNLSIFDYRKKDSIHMFIPADGSREFEEAVRDVAKSKRRRITNTLATIFAEQTLDDEQKRATIISENPDIALFDCLCHTVPRSASSDRVNKRFGLDAIINEI